MTRRLETGLLKQVQALDIDDNKTINRKQRCGWRKQRVEKFEKKKIQSLKTKSKHLFTVTIYFGYASGHIVKTKNYFLRRESRKILMWEL